MTLVAFRRRPRPFYMTAYAAFIPLLLTLGVATHPSVVHDSIILRHDRAVKVSDSISWLRLGNVADLEDR